MTTQSGTKSGGDLRILARCYTFLRPYLRFLLPAELLLLFITALQLLIPQLVRGIIDRGIRQQDARMLGLLVLLLLGAVLVKGVFTFLQGRWIELASQGVAYDLRRKLHEQLTLLSFSFHDRSEAGQLLSRAVQDVERIRFLTGRATLRLLEGTLLLAGTCAMLLWMSPRLAVFALLAMPLLLYRAFLYGRKIRPLSLRIQEQLAVLTTRLEQNLRGTRIVRAFAREEDEIRRFREQNERWRELSRSEARIRAVEGPLLILIANIATALIIWYGGSLIIAGRLTLW